MDNDAHIQRRKSRALGERGSATSASTGHLSAAAKAGLAGSDRGVAVIDHGAIRTNVQHLTESMSGTVMAVVKADAYGHGAEPVARSALEAGATWLGVALRSEAMALRAVGITAPILFWLATQNENYTAAIDADIDIGVSSNEALDSVIAAARCGRPASVHLKVDTGLGRNGVTFDEWPTMLAAARKAERSGIIRIRAIWSHLACADEPRHPATTHQCKTFDRALAIASRYGIDPPLRHLANSAAALTLPSTHYELVRVGIATVGISPSPALGTSYQLGLKPAMTVSAGIANVKSVGAGYGVSYGHRYHTGRATRLALIPLGYADGIPRQASNRGPVAIGSHRYRVAGTIAMDQFVIDLGDTPAAIGDPVRLFGPGDDGEPTVEEWADAADTIAYEIVTRLGPRLPRRHVNITAPN